MIIRRSRVLVALALLGLMAGACSSSKSPAGSSGATTTVVAKQGGDLVVSAEQEPACMDWLDACASAAWGLYTVESTTLEGAYDFTNNSVYVPSPVLTGPATLVTSPQQVVTYHINPKAVWSDGQPITSADFKYTWDQIVNGKNIISTTGYSNIASVDDTDPHTAVVTFKQTFADWQSLFDNGSLESLLPSHILQGKDRDATMKDGYTFSDGPWMLDHWTKGVEIKIVPNPNYWGKKPNLASITFKFITDTAAEQQAVKTGQVDVAYPQAVPGPQPLRGLPGITFDAVPGLSYEGLWFNVEKAPLNDKAVRQALAYATDRNAIVTQLFGPTEPGIQPIQSWYTPAFGTAVYTTPFSKYTLDLGQVTTLMTGAGWAKGADGIWAKGGQKANLELKTTAGNIRRAQTAQILQSEWKQAGFNLTITTEKAGVLFGSDLPSGNFQIGLYAQTPTDSDVAECIEWCSKNIPGTANGGQGQNYDRINDPALDTPWLDADTNLNQATRLTDAHTGQSILAEDMPALPVDPFPDIIVVNTDKVGSQTGSFLHNFAWGPFVYANYWFMK